MAVEGVDISVCVQSPCFAPGLRRVQNVRGFRCECRVSVRLKTKPADRGHRMDSEQIGETVSQRSKAMQFAVDRGPTLGRPNALASNGGKRIGYRGDEKRNQTTG